MTQTVQVHNPWIVVGLVALFVLIIFWFVWSWFRRRDEVWSGTVIDKRISENVQSTNTGMNQPSGITIGGIGIGPNQTAVTHSYTIVVKTDDGKQITWPISSGFYETVKIGDHLQKPHGTQIPEIVGQAQAGAPTPPIAPTPPVPPAQNPPTPPTPPTPPSPTA